MDIIIMVLTTVKHNICFLNTRHISSHNPLQYIHTASWLYHKSRPCACIYVWWRNKLHFLFEITVTFNVSLHNEITAIVTEIICTWRGWLVGLSSSAANGKGYTGMFSLLVVPSLCLSVSVYMPVRNVREELVNDFDYIFRIGGIWHKEQSAICWECYV